ncbi:MAG TPA: hypothetical protein VK462_06250 [Nitrososphaeraceae archaeon]|nr:hypothetical protein [Nitrososphaeraceae archaeon]
MSEQTSATRDDGVNATNALNSSSMGSAAQAMNQTSTQSDEDIAIGGDINSMHCDGDVS